MSAPVAGGRASVSPAVVGTAVLPRIALASSADATRPTARRIPCLRIPLHSLHQSGLGLCATQLRRHYDSAREDCEPDFGAAGSAFLLCCESRQGRGSAGGACGLALWRRSTSTFRLREA